MHFLPLLGRNSGDVAHRYALDSVPNYFQFMVENQHPEFFAARSKIACFHPQRRVLHFYVRRFLFHSGRSEDFPIMLP